MPPKARVIIKRRPRKARARGGGAAPAQRPPAAAPRKKQPRQKKGSLYGPLMAKQWPVFTPTQVYTVRTSQRFNVAVPKGERAVAFVAPVNSCAGLYVNWAPPFATTQPVHDLSRTFMLTRVIAGYDANRPPGQNQATSHNVSSRVVSCCARLLTTTPLAQVGGTVVGRRFQSSPAQRPWDSAAFMVDFWNLLNSGSSTDVIPVAALTHGTCVRNRPTSDNFLRFRGTTHSEAVSTAIWSPTVFDVNNSGLDRHSWDLLAVAFEAPPDSGLDLIVEIEYVMEMIPEPGTVVESGATMRTNTNTQSVMRTIRPTSTVFQGTQATRASRTTAGYTGWGGWKW